MQGSSFMLGNTHKVSQEDGRSRPSLCSQSLGCLRSTPAEARTSLVTVLSVMGFPFLNAWKLFTRASCTMCRRGQPLNAWFMFLRWFGITCTKAVELGSPLAERLFEFVPPTTGTGLFDLECQSHHVRVGLYESKATLALGQ